VQRFRLLEYGGMADLLQEKLTALLEAAAHAHHEYEQAELEGVRDEQWPAWYANYLINNGLGALLGSQADLDEVAAALDQLTQQQKTEGNSQPWAAYAAAELLNRLA
jgi:hypothetical protein